MSRVGKNSVEVPEGVNVAIVGQQVTAKGKLGELSMTFRMMLISPKKQIRSR